MEVQPVPGERALLARADDATVLVAADLHMGLERRMAEEGWHMPSSTRGIVARLHALVEAHGVDVLALVGDIKDSVHTPSRQEESELPTAIGELADMVGEIHLIKGNHDGDLEAWVPYRKHLTVHGARGARVHGLGLCHGHTWPLQEVMSADFLVLAHNHPSVEFTDRLGHRLREPAWFRTRLTGEHVVERYGPVDPEVILMPPFNELLSGTPLNRPDYEGLGPLLTRGYVDLENAEVYLVDGIHLGRLGSLVPEEEG
ncbi:MAG: metallophosphoesterase [Thermoplasmata archaeon]|nr:MAG: metallophosphoesterase [Thermoplasmata archaeon]